MAPFIVPPAAAAASGGSLAYEELRGDLSTAAVLTDDALNRARRNGDAQAIAKALVSRGIVALLQGEPRRALLYLQDHAVAQADPATRYRAAALVTLAHAWNVNLFPNRSGAGGVELMPAMSDYMTSLGESTRARKALEHQVHDVGLRREVSLVQQLTTLQTMRAIVASGASTGLPPQAMDMLRTCGRDVYELHQTVVGDGNAPSMVAYLERLLAEYIRLIGDDPTDVLTAARTSYHDNGDLVGEASCLMLAGDWLASDLSSPVVWNVAVSESGSEGSHLPWSVEEREFNLTSGRVDEARAMYSEAHALFTKANAGRGLGAVSLRYVYLALLADDIEAAAQHVADARAHFERSGDRQGEWLARVQQALVRIWLGVFPEDEKTAREVGEWGATHGSFSYALGLGLFVGRVARYWMVRRGSYARALAAYRFAESLYESLGALENQIQSVVDQANVYRVIGESDETVTRLEHAIDLRRTRTGPAPDGIGVNQREVMIAHELYALALEAMDPERMQRALDRAEAALARADTGATDVTAFGQSAARMLIGNAREQATVLIPAYAAQRAKDNGDDAEADALIADAIAAAEKIPGDQRDFMLAVVLGQARRYDEAAAVFRRRRERQRRGSDAHAKSVIALMEQFGSQVSELEQTRQARYQLEQAASMFTRLKAYDDALAAFEELERTSGPRWWSAETRPWETLESYGEACEGSGQYDRALSLYDEGITELEQRRELLGRDELKRAIASGKSAQWIFFLAARTCARLYARADASGDVVAKAQYAARIFRYAERGKARGLLDLVASSVSVAGGSAESPLIAEWRRLGSLVAVRRGLLARARETNEAQSRDRIAAFEAEIAENEDQLAGVEARLASEDPDFYHAMNPQVDVRGLDVVSGKLTAGTLLLQYYFVGDDFLAWAMTDRGIVDVRHISLATRRLSHDIRQFHHACATRQADWATRADALAATFLRPFDGLIAEASRIIIVPYAASHELPFHVLPWNGGPLGLSRTVSYLPSASLLEFTRGDTTLADQHVLVVGNPWDMRHRDPITQHETELPELRAASVEAAYVASLFGDRSCLLRETRATKAAVQPELACHPILHFATHGVISSGAPLLSAISLADGEEFTLYELMTIRLNAELAVLSACETARGEQTRGDDVVGFTRGLLAAGARRALVTLWEVNDESTTLLVSRFYERLRAGATPVDALRDAETYVHGLTEWTAVDDLVRIETVAAAYVPGANVPSLPSPSIEPAVRGRISGRISRPNGVAAVDDAGIDLTHPHYWAPFILVG